MLLSLGLVKSRKPKCHVIDTIGLMLNKKKMEYIF
jgi:hypothetical protein